MLFARGIRRDDYCQFQLRTPVMVERDADNVMIDTVRFHRVREAARPS